MFKDLKEYQEITQLYHDSVNISEEQRAINTAIAEANFTDEEIIYLDENFDELWESELSILAEEAISDCLVEENLNEEQLQEAAKAKATVAAAKGIGGMFKKGISAIKKRIPQGVKDTVKGGISAAKSAIDKAKPVIKAGAKGALKTLPKVGLVAGGLGALAVGGSKVIGALRNRGKKEREIIQKAKDDAAIKKGIEDAKKTGIPNNTAVQGGAMSQKAREQAAFNRGERKARVDLKDPTLNDNMKKKTETETKPMSKKDKFNAKFIKKDKGVGFVKRGTPGAQRAENKEKAKLRAQAMAKARIEAKKKAEAEVKEEFDAYDMVLMYLNATEQVTSIEEANYIMTEMDQQTIGEIVKQVKEALIDEGMLQPYIKPTFPLIKDKRTGEYMTTDGKPFDLQKFKDDYNKKKQGNMGKDKPKTGM